MTDETQAAEPASTPTEAEAPETGFTGLPVTKAPSGPAPGYTTVSSGDWQTTRPPFILSFVESDHPQGGFVIGWDTCGACNMHLRTCKCKNGPEQPAYVKRWRPAADTDHDKPRTVSTGVRKAIVAADPQAVDDAVDDALGGRKRRSDAGQPRGPRKKADATPDSVAQAAGDLAGAMSKE